MLTSCNRECQTCRYTNRVNQKVCNTNFETDAKYLEYIEEKSGWL